MDQSGQEEVLGIADGQYLTDLKLEIADPPQHAHGTGAAEVSQRYGESYETVGDPSSKHC